MCGSEVSYVHVQNGLLWVMSQSPVDILLHNSDDGDLNVEFTADINHCRHEIAGSVKWTNRSSSDFSITVETFVV